MSTLISAAGLGATVRPESLGSARSGDQELQSTFQQAVAGLFFGQLMKSLRSTVGEPAYIHGGQAEKMFQAQLDQVLIEDLAEHDGGAFVGDLYRQFRIQQGLPVAPTAGDSAAKSPQISSAAQATASPRPSQVVEAAHQARSVVERTHGAIDTAGLTGLFRK